MRALLMHQDRDWDPQQPLPSQEGVLKQDLGLDTLAGAMAGDDPFLFDVALKALLLGVRSDVDTILYRQAILKDCLENPAVVRELYALAGEAIEAKKRCHIGVFGRYPSSILYGSIEALRTFMTALITLKGTADAQAGRFESKGFTALFAMIQAEFSVEYFARVHAHLTELAFRAGVLVSARLGQGNQGTNYVLRRTPDDRRSWLERLVGKSRPAYTFRIHERDEAGARALSELRNRGINLVANALAQSTDHILGFFDMLRSELAFYVGCLNLHDRLASLAAPTCLPQPMASGVRRQRFGGLYDVCLALSTGRRVSGNDLNADGKSVAIITGANQGGKSTFLRSIGLSQLMMQCGMFAPAETFAGELCAGLFTHYRREEDATMTHGKLDEELARLSGIVDALSPNAMVLFNESFASTNEREGSEIARQVVDALQEKRIKVFFVTHLYDFAHRVFERNSEDVVFVRAERRPDGTRTFRLAEGEPLDTSYGEDLYKEIFAADA